MVSTVCCGVWLELSSQKPIRGVVCILLNTNSMYTERYKEWEGFRRSRHCRKNRNLDGEKLIFKIRPRKSERKTKAAKHLLYVFVRKHFRLFQLRSQPVDCNLIGVESAEDTYRQNIFISKDLHDHIAVPGNRF